ncbi:hypothetical protein EWM64_g8679 [Hericium alpestre]|uniref:Uncharacterized protein n=1 Tax=Hericium alpestre TaxID=135208 RepID=A0A4Y9ZMX7_9AGAM|nr:hypothetical protein EWM64_g8679 [Hericium alpestre]
MYAQLPVASILAALCVLIPMPWHWRARNIATLSIIAWLFISNMIYFVNSIVWADSARVVIPVWCDIVTKLQMGANIGLPAACLCVCVRLESIAAVRSVTVSRASKQRRMLFDAGMCWGLPVLYMALHYVVQGHRFDIIENFGCRPTVYVSIAAIFIVFIPPLVLSVTTLVFAGLALAHFFRRRMMFAKHLQQSNSGLTTARYFRLMLMAVVEMFWTIVVSALNVYFTTRSGLRPWTGWGDVHFDFPQIGQFPFVLISMDDRRWTFALWWTLPVSSYIFFLFFGFGEDALREYRKCMDWVRVHIFRRPTSSSSFAPMGSSSRYSPSVPVPLSSTSSFGTETKPSVHAYGNKILSPKALEAADAGSSVNIASTPPHTPLDHPASAYYLATFAPVEQPPPKHARFSFAIRL